MPLFRKRIAKKTSSKETHLDEPADGPVWTRIFLLCVAAWVIVGRFSVVCFYLGKAVMSGLSFFLFSSSGFGRVYNVQYMCPPFPSFLLNWLAVLIPPTQTCGKDIAGMALC